MLMNFMEQKFGQGIVRWLHLSHSRWTLASKFKMAEGIESCIIICENMTEDLNFNNLEDGLTLDGWLESLLDVTS